MVEEIINSIIDAENKAEKIKKNAVLEARELVSKEEDKADKERKDFEKQCKQQIKDNTLIANKNADEEALKIKLKGGREAADIEAEAEKNIDKAAEAILQELLN